MRSLPSIFLRAPRVATGLLCALLTVGPSGCLEERLLAAVLVLDPQDGSTLEEKSRWGEPGQVSVSMTPPGTDDVLAWGPRGIITLWDGDGWREIEAEHNLFTLAPTTGGELPDVFTVTNTHATVWSMSEASAQSSVETIPGPEQILAADWDGDGDMDLVGKSSGYGVWVHLRDGVRLEAPTMLREAFGLNQAIAIGDLDQDGRLDLVHTHQEDVVVAYAGPAGVIEEEFQIRPPDIEFREVALGDITGDGRLDVVLSGEYGVQLLHNAGGRTLTIGDAFEDIVPITEVLDMDGDGDLDIIGQPPRSSDESWGSELLVIRNAGGTLENPEPLFDVGEDIVDLASGTNADGKVWLAVGTFTTERGPRRPEVRR